MTKLEEALGRLGNLELDKNTDDIINYLENNKEKIVIEKQEFSLTDIISFAKNPSLILEKRQIEVADNGIKTYHFNKKFIDLVSKHMSSSISSLTIPASYFNKNSVFKYQNLEELNLNINKYDLFKIDLKTMKQLLNQTKIRKLDVDCYLDDQVLLENCCGIKSFMGSKLNMDGLNINSRNYQFNPKVEGFVKNDGTGVNEVLDLALKNKTSDIEGIKIYNNYKCGYGNDKIDYQKYKKGSIIEFGDTECQKDVKAIKIKNIEHIMDVFDIVNSFQERGFEVEAIYLFLENKTYDDMNLLRQLDKKYDLKIKYDGSLQVIDSNTFVGMRDSIDYYKDVINNSNSSNLEKIMLAYDIVKSFPYKERKDNLRISREVATIIKDGNIVCVGYSQLLSQILKETGVDSYTISTSVPVGDDVIGHERNVIVVDDDKYDIHGNYVFDVTWDSAKNITKCIDSEGKNVLRSKSSPILDTDQVVKHYDNLVLYRYFLISDNRYNSCFPGEPYPDFKYAEKISSSGKTFDDDTLGSKELEQSKFIELLYNVKLREGYSDANVEEEIEDIFDFLGNYSKDDIKKEIEKIINNNSKQV